MNAAVQQTADSAPASSPAASKRKTEYVEVTMTDGRKVSFPYNAETQKGRQLQKQSLIPGEDGYSGSAAVRLDFVNGETRTYAIPGAELLSDYLDDPNFAARAKFLLKHATHGAEQKLGDELAYTPKAGESPPSLEDKIEWIDELMQRLDALEWGTEREANPLAGASNLVKALMELSGKSKDEVRAFLKPMSREERALVKSSPPVKKVLDRMDAEAAKASGKDVSGALGALGIAV